METIKTLVQNLILIVVLTVFLEMLLPSGIMKRYVKVIMGLVVLVSFLQTGSGLLHQNIDLFLPASTNLPANQEEAKQIMAAGQQLAGQNQSEALHKYREGLEHQVSAIASLNGQLSIKEVHVAIQDDPQNKDYGKLQEINMTVTARIKKSENEEELNPLIEPVDIQLTEKSDEVEKVNSTNLKNNPKTEEIEEVKETVASFYNLSPNQVKISCQE
ncbi:hypothetical protein Dtox_2606 [Desulfofarcimen acetoxidans DSM 771]|uniref:Stage III sporulation protein AF n=1 Tax=Desulfofarcimen acetoxidans (strain ATCC 49208 / DSM 771 / KCTC 5769 / VKM B-1644 / 5575) TaxID=485916 RepID=C8W103_DESAS|nr:hypothetical protein Dtox_2606 [Desulfofarcimen acetoxidans DSM 771]